MKVLNPKTNRKITVNGKVYLGLLEEGYVHDVFTNTMVHTKLSNENEPEFNTGVYTPKKYFAGLTDTQKKKRLQRIQKGAKSDSSDPSSYSSFPTDTDPKTGKKRKTKTSSYTKAFYEKFPKAKSLEEKSKATGIPKEILSKVYDKGLAAWRTGHRPGATQGQWGSARVHSFIMKGCTHYFPDHKLVEKAKKQSPKAKEFWSKQKCICRKGCKSGKK